MPATAVMCCCSRVRGADGLFSNGVGSGLGEGLSERGSLGRCSISVREAAVTKFDRVLSHAYKPPR